MTTEERNNKQQWDSHDLTEAISELYRSGEYQELINQSQEQTLMQMTGCERSETAHSAFLANLFRTKPCSRGDSASPLFHFLRLLANKAKEQASNCKCQLSDLMPQDLWNNIIINNCSVDVVKVRTESVTTFKEADGRADIVIDCRISYPSVANPYLLRIVIENKIDSKERQKGIGQCQKYADYYDDETTKKLFGIRDNIFVYLSPTLSENLSSPRFIKVTYTDLLHNVLKVVYKQRSAYDENMAKALEEYIKTICSQRNNPTIAMNEESIELARKFFYKNRELISRVIEAVAEDNLKKAVRKALNTQIDYRVTYNQTTYDGTTKINKLAYQTVCLLEKNGFTANDINNVFKSVCPKKEFLLSMDPGRNKGEKISIQGKDYWVPTNIWAANSNYVDNLFEVFSDIPGLSYETSE